MHIILALIGLIGTVVGLVAVCMWEPKVSLVVWNATAIVWIFAYMFKN